MEEWNRTFGGTQRDCGRFVQQTGDGGYIVAGFTNSYGAEGQSAWVIKTDPIGNELWNRTFGGSIVDEACYAGEADGGYVLVATIQQAVSPFYSFVHLIRLDAGGNALGESVFGGRYGGMAKSAQRTSDGGYIIAGYTNSYGSGGFDAWVIRTDSLGNELWNRTYGGGGDQWADYVFLIADGGFALLYREAVGTYRLRLMRADALGNPLWDKAYCSVSLGTSISQDADGGFMATALISDAHPNRIYLLKTSADGTEEWNRTLGGGWNDQAWSALSLADGGYLVAGTNASYKLYSDAWLLKIDGLGGLTWDRLFGGETSGETFYSIKPTSDGCYILTGSTYSYGEGNGDAWLIKLRLITSGWAGLGGGLLSKPWPLVEVARGDGIGGGTEQPGRLHLFALGKDQALWHCQDGAWYKLGGLGLYHPQAMRYTIGFLIFLVGSDHQLWNLYQGVWSCLGGYTTSPPFAIRDGSGRPHVLVLGADNSIWDWRMGYAQPWYGLGGRVISDPYAVLDGQGRMHILAVGEDSSLWDYLEGTWHYLGGKVASNPAAVVDPAAPQKLAILIKGSDGALWLLDLDTSSMEGSWHSLGGLLTSNPSAIIDADGLIHVYVRGSDGSLWEKRFDPEDLGSASWIPHGGLIKGDPMALADEEIYVAVVGDDDQAYVHVQ
ncbi:MAG: hypothetical protein JW986_01910 [Methanotrichaceae archaeon]|nr:hypothetical protein [Methanotrichaceae archaeon]